MVSYLSLPLERSKLQDLLADAKDFVYGLGFVIRSPKNPTSADAVMHAPFTLFPSPLLRSCFHEAELVQTDFNLLMHRVARNTEFLKDCLSSVIESDDFTRRLWDISETIRKEGKTQTIILALNRSDYMIGTDGDDCNEATAHGNGNSQSNNDGPASNVKVSLKQIEFNTIAASFAGLAQNLSTYHRFQLERLDFGKQNVNNVPENRAAAGLAQGMVSAWKLYGNSSAAILFLVYEVERNIYDHRHLEYAVYRIDNNVKVIRRTLKDVQARGQLTSDKRLIIDGMEVSVVYMRCCYKPTDYDGDADWETRLMIERSHAIVCPTAAYQLAGTKKVQQVLAAPGVVERFINDSAAVHRIRSTFADQFSLDLDEEGNKNTELGIEKPHLFVLKPQREGGGNNTYGDAVRTELTKMRNSTERSSYILMRRIHPVVVKNYPVASERPTELTDMVCEVGIYGSLVANGDEIITNDHHGYLLRTKPVGTDEGGVATGYSVLDSPYLVDSWPPVLVDGTALSGANSKSILKAYQMDKASFHSVGIQTDPSHSGVYNETIPSQSMIAEVNAGHSQTYQTEKASFHSQGIQTDPSHSELGEVVHNETILSQSMIAEVNAGHSQTNQTEKASFHSVGIQTDPSNSGVYNEAILSQSVIAEGNAVHSQTNQTEKASFHSQGIQTDPSHSELGEVVIDETVATTQFMNAQIDAGYNQHYQMGKASFHSQGIQTDPSHSRLDEVVNAKTVPTLQSIHTENNSLHNRAVQTTPGIAGVQSDKT